ncbi:MAG: NapC/NirT family cytochrome c [Deltaproteobacteria bacterium]|nr:NapC/NirT family cytochrome c [Candidatus Desulfobacula maris]MBL6995745.1 NapC/NirT family cytochrome c [Desulfobacula sp.]
MVVAGIIAILSMALASIGGDSEDKQNQFCIFCHEMKNTVYKEYQKTIHYSNRSGMRAACNDCHVPTKIIPAAVRKVKASKELWAKFQGTIDTPGKFEKKRLTMAKLVWADMESNNSRECRTCHLVQGIDFKQFKKPDAAKRMKKGLEEGQTCINCHKGIAHEMPDMASGFKARYNELETLSLKEKKEKGMVFTFTTKPFFLEKNDTKKAGKILPGTQLEILERTGDKLKVKIDGWQQDGVAPLIYALQGKRIFSAALGKKALPEVQVLKTMVDADTDLTWHEVSLTCWITSDILVSDQEKLWEYGADMHSASCSPCHSATPANHFLANQWMGSLKSMSRNTNLDKEEYRFLLKYLQFNASDTGGGHH